MQFLGLWLMCRLWGRECVLARLHTIIKYCGDKMLAKDSFASLELGKSL